MSEIETRQTAPLSLVLAPDYRSSILTEIVEFSSNRGDDDKSKDFIAGNKSLLFEKYAHLSFTYAKFNSVKSA